MIYDDESAVLGCGVAGGGGGVGGAGGGSSRTAARRRRRRRRRRPLPYPQSKPIYEEETGKTNFE